MRAIDYVVSLPPGTWFYRAGGTAFITMEEDDFYHIREYEVFNSETGQIAHLSEIVPYQMTREEFEQQFVVTRKTNQG